MVGSRVKHFRELNNLNREFLADQLGIDASQLNRIENNRSEINVSRLLKIAAILKISVIELFEEKDLFIEHPKNYENYGPIESSYIRYVIYQNELMQKENHELALRFKQVLENMQEQQTQFKRLLDHFTEKEKTPKAPKIKWGDNKP